MKPQSRLKWTKLTEAQRARVVALLVQMVLRRLAACQEGKRP